MSGLLPFDGKLSKYTNVMKGWQNRYFILNPQQGVLEYHISKQEAMGSHHRPRGAIVLAGAVIAPSTEDSFTFSVNSANGEVYKLRASSTKERQEWVSNVRAVVQHFTHQIAQEHPPLLHQSSGRKPRSRSMVSNLSTNLNKIKDQVHNLSTGQPATSHGENNSSSVDQQTDQQTSKHSTKSKKIYRSGSSSRKSHSGKRALQGTEIKELQDAKEALVSVDNYQTGLISMLDDLRYHDSKFDKNESNSADENEASINQSSDTITALDTSVLLMKSTSASMLQSLNKCYNILQRYSMQSNPTLPADADIKWVTATNNSNSDSASKEVVSFEVPTLANASDEEEENKEEQEQDLGAVDEHKNIIMHLLSQLKLGMDLTKVTLPTFILEKRSLLEMYADFVACTDLLLDIPNGATPVERMHKTLKFYLSSFYCGRKAQVAKKPYNPIVGEVFQCSYYVPKDDSTAQQPKEDCHRVQFLAEQVSHHPPVSAFYASCPDRGITVNSHIWTKSKFMNMSVGVANIGEGVLHLSEHKESYVMTYPSAFARSILTVPWTELGGRCGINCGENNLSCNVIFHTKPMYGGQPHRVTAEVKDVKTGFVSCKVSGKWNGELEFSYYTKVDESDDVIETTEVVDTTTLKQFHKYLRPIEQQSAMESRTLWRNVTEALRKGDVISATEHKSALERQQREVENRRSEEGLDVPLAYFTQVKGKDSDSYTFNQTPAIQS